MKTDRANHSKPSDLERENADLRGEVRVARRASDLTAELVVQQFARIEEIVRKLEQKAETEQELGQKLAEKLREAGLREEELARERQQLEEMQIAAINMMEDIASARRAAEAATQAKSEFLANMSHEIRTPMTAILGFADLLLERGHLDDTPGEHVDAVRTIKRNGEHLLGIINDILDLSKVEAGKMQVERIPTSPCRMMADVASLVRPQAEGKGLAFEVRYAGPVPDVIHTDPTRLRQILVNLLGNAVKFTEVGRVCLTARLSEEGEAPAMVFEVEDTGVGMSRAQLAGLFQPFMQADTSTTRRFGGTGLGLTISKRFAEMLDGGIAVRSTPGTGSVFTVTIAAGSLEGVELITDPVAETAVLHEAAEAASSLESLSLNGCRVLLAEDGPDNQRLITHILNQAGAEVVVRENGKLVVEAILDEASTPTPFDVVLMDMQMPVMDGYEATRFLRSKGYQGPVIALTAHAMTGDREKCLTAGCNDYATKPVNRKRLLRVIQSALTTCQTAPHA